MQTLKSRRAAVLALLALASAVATPAWSQTYPARPVKLVTQGAAGSGSDVVARLVTDQLSRMWDQQIVILNHPGAGGSAAARVAAAAAPDGYTLYVAATSTFIAMHEMFPNLPLIAISRRSE
jgi:tripartite-type tricarboxylate transporter receptor subunit TctC